ncbi:unnamed protein product [Symbiodinium natans]|uniref:Uncharacterized protein n=1 Tax=Symbiodinium natans TaxID=878477 RepID=A0A812QBX4_9DINO|nr:unnamed protein product [Symbiodinium natans]
MGPAKDPDLPDVIATGVGHIAGKKDAFVVRNTFIDQIPGTPSSPNGAERQVHSCPGTSLLDHATPQQEDARKLGIGATVLAAVPSSPGSDCDSNKSGLHGSRDQKPWSPDVVQKLVDEAAAVLEMHTPSLPGASRRSSPMMAKASPLMKGADLVSSAVADAAAAADASPEVKPPEICGTPSPWQNHSHSRQEFCCATPSPWQGSAVINPEITAKLLAMGQQKGSDGSVQDPVAMIVASAAAAANKEPPPPPAQAPPAQYSKAANSPLLAPPLRLPRIESGIASIEEGDNSAFHSASSDPEIAPDALAMAESFASLVKPDQLGAEHVQWWQPMKETLSTEEEAGILDFIQRWGLDGNCDRVLRNLPSHVRQEVLASFLASPDTRNVSAKFMSWLSSRMRNFEEIQSALVTTPEERRAFYERWRLDQKCRQLVEEQAPSVQRELISNFNPPAGTKNVAGRMTAFLNMILNKTRRG